MAQKRFVVLALVGLVLATVGCDIIYQYQNPVAVIAVTFSRAQPGVGFSVSGAASYDPGGAAITSYEWNFGDGTPIVSSGMPIVSHAYAQGGDYLITLVVTSANGLKSSPAAVPMSVNRRPMALARISQEPPQAGQVVYLLCEGFAPEAIVPTPTGIIPVPMYEYWKIDASVSYDPDGIIIGYHWQWADHDLGVASVIWVRVPVGSTYYLFLEVFDNEGAWGWTQVGVGAIG